MAVWIPEIVDYFNTTLPTIKVDGTPINITFSKPDITARPDDIEKYLPEINYKYYDQVGDKKRYESDILLTRNANSTTKKIDTKKVSEPYQLFFQFILAAKNMDDIVQMESQFTSVFPLRGYISVTDPSVTPSDIYDIDMFQIHYQIADTDELATPRYGQVPMRIFRRLFRYVIHCEHDIYNWSTVPLTTSVKPTAKPM